MLYLNQFLSVAGVAATHILETARALVSVSLVAVHLLLVLLVRH